ncbi:MAG: hypothetical protein ACTSVX_11555 [Promethearchaeota archaeon]
MSFFFIHYVKYLLSWINLVIQACCTFLDGWFWLKMLREHAFVDQLRAFIEMLRLWAILSYIFLLVFSWSHSLPVLFFIFKSMFFIFH